MIEKLRESQEKINGFSEGDEISLKEKIQSLWSNKIYLGLTSSLSGLFFVVTGIQYWLPTYLKNNLGATEQQAASYYLALSFTAPIAGVIIGGFVTTYFGGYNTLYG